MIKPAHAATIPFLVQAPFGQWSDPRLHEGCEEAVALMAMAWSRGETITPEEGRHHIIAISDWQKRRFGTFEDTSIQDTADRIMRLYIGMKNVEVHQYISSENVRDQIQAGHVVIVPIDGRRLGNPFYRRPGPRHHVLLVTGYDKNTDTFTVQDPGTRKGANMKFSRAKLQNALQDYPTGNGRSSKKLPASMIVIRKQ